ncbi:MAG TPA: 6,7-dimethyl-8-ribityllumazine synthase [Coxiellaceae bacterium]|nr:6,7-dimethyl-8-ribityllumazine synthase [Coxiellaceae bacterium]
MKIAIVVSRFNEAVNQRLLNSTVARLEEKGVIRANLDIRWVPGAVEIPLVAKKMAKTGHYSAIIVLGTVIRGQTDHYEYVCQQVSYGCQKVALEHEIPVIFGVLTVNNRQQALARSGGDHSDKGHACADAALEMIEVLAKESLETALV